MTVLLMTDRTHISSSLLWPSLVFTENEGENKRGEELNAAANVSVWKGIMPVLNIAARLGRHRAIYA